MKNLVTFLFLTVIISLISCTAFTSKKNLSNLESVVIRAENNYKTYSEQDWAKSDKNFEEVSTKILSNKSDYSQAQIDKAHLLIGKYEGLKLKAGFNVFKESLKGLGKQIEGAVDVLTDTTK